MQARRFWNLLKLLRIDGEEPDLEIQCQILQIKKQDLITFMRDEEKNVPQEPNSFQLLIHPIVIFIN